jgi:2-polyprenyl-3-methyl-5-hydroxy-6-metoxy-1,4-benzoquinol methylase
MMATAQSSDALGVWTAIADFWDEGVGQDGNMYWKVLQRPCLERLVTVRSGSKALDLATGNGLVARWLAGRGATVLATDGSHKMLEHAARRTPAELVDQIAYRQLDVTDSAAFDAFLDATGVVRS